MDRRTPELAAVVPAWNERENMELLLRASCEELEGPVIGWGIVVADGGSHDGMAEAGRPWRNLEGLGQAGGGDRKGTPWGPTPMRILRALEDKPEIGHGAVSSRANDLQGLVLRYQSGGAQWLRC